MRAACWRDRRGNYSMIVVLLLPVLTGFVGVGTEAGLWLYDQQSQQTATDSAAFSAAIYYKAQEPVSGSDTTSAPNGQAQALRRRRQLRLRRDRELCQLGQCQDLHRAGQLQH